MTGEANLLAPYLWSESLSGNRSRHGSRAVQLNRFAEIDALAAAATAGAGVFHRRAQWNRVADHLMSAAAGRESLFAAAAHVDRLAKVDSFSHLLLTSQWREYAFCDYDVKCKLFIFFVVDFLRLSSDDVVMEKYRLAKSVWIARSLAARQLRHPTLAGSIRLHALLADLTEFVHDSRNVIDMESA